MQINVKNYKFRISFLASFICFICIFTYLLICLFPTPVHAQTLSLSLWPPLLEVMVQPGRTLTAVYKLTNNSDHKLSITPQIFPFEPAGENGQIRISFASPSTFTTPSSSPTFSFDSGEILGRSFAFPVGQTKEMVLKITIPSDAQEKDYYYTLLFSTAEEPIENGGQKDRGQTGSISQIGSNLLLTVSRLGKPVFLGKIVSFSAPAIIDSFSPVEFEVILENWGKTFWKSFGKIEITGIFRQKEEIKLLEQNVLANSSRRLEISRFRPKLPFGPFRATLDFSLNEDGQNLFTEITFWYLPYKFVLGLMPLLLVFFLIQNFKKRLKNRSNKASPPLDKQF